MSQEAATGEEKFRYGILRCRALKAALEARLPGAEEMVRRELAEVIRASHWQFLGMILEMLELHCRMTLGEDVMGELCQEVMEYEIKEALQKSRN